MTQRSFAYRCCEHYERHRAIGRCCWPSLAPARRRAHPMRCLSALLQAQRRAARPLLRARPARRPNRAHHLRPLLGFLCRSDREKAVKPFPAGHARTVVRHGRVQPHLQVLPELGRLEGSRDGPASRRGLTRGHRARRDCHRLTLHRLHLQRPGHLPRICGGCRQGGAQARHQERRRHSRLRQPRGTRGALQLDGCGQRRPQGLYGGVL